MRRGLTGALLLAGCVSAEPISDAGPEALSGPPCEAPTTWFLDADDDGFGDAATARPACARPEGWTDVPGDCDDADPGTFPGAIEVCDGVDRDCDGRIDADAIDAEAGFLDDDGDGFGGERWTGCRRDPRWTERRGDCDDTRADVFPGAEDPACDGVDQDCAGGGGPEVAQVAGDGFATLQEAVDATDGPPVWICPGTHAVEIVAEGPRLDLRPWEGGPVTLVPARHGARILDLDARSVSLVGLTLRGGAVDGDGGLFRVRADQVELRRLVLRDGRATGDGGCGLIEAREAPRYDRWRIDDLDLSDCAAGGSGGALALRGRPPEVNTWLELSRLDVHETQAAVDGGGLVLDELEAVRLRSILAADTLAGRDGGLVAARGPRPTVSLTGSSLTGHHAGRDGGALSARATPSPDDRRGGRAMLTVDESTVHDSHAGHAGGGLAAVGVGPAEAHARALLRGRIEGCSAERGGGIAVVPGAAATWASGGVQGGRLADNHAIDGAGILLDASGTTARPTLTVETLTGHRGSPAAVVRTEPGVDVVGFARIIGPIRGNVDGGVQVTGPAIVDLSKADLGAGPDDNTPWDLWWSGRGWSWEEQVDLRCEDGACEAR